MRERVGRLEERGWGEVGGDLPFGDSFFRYLLVCSPNAVNSRGCSRLRLETHTGFFRVRDPSIRAFSLPRGGINRKLESETELPNIIKIFLKKKKEKNKEKELGFTQALQ